MTRKAKIVVYEGPDAIGKKTQSMLLYNFLLSRNYKVSLYEIPFRNRLYSSIYYMLYNGHAIKFPITFMIIQFLNKLFFEYFVLRKSLKENDIVILDRWRLSTYVYGYCTSKSNFLSKLLMCLSKKPDITFVFEGKSFKRDNQDVYEKNNNLQEDIRIMYHEFANKHSNDHFIVNANQEKKEILEQIFMRLQEKKIV